MAVTVQAPRTTPSRKRFTVEEYHRLAEVGVLHEDDRIELIDGELIEMAAIGIAHADTLATLTDFAAMLVSRAARISVQNPITIGQRSEPQPDLALIRRRRYNTSHPTPADIFLVIEVADSSLAYDRLVKLPLYAAAGIPEVWIVDLQGMVIERHSAPRDGRYTQIVIAAPGEMLASLTLPAFNVAVADIFLPDTTGHSEG
jgi:Uma2 family endonuclease